jgi:formylglycine-generating enzyme
MNRFFSICLVSAAVLLFGRASFADTFGSGADAFTIDFVTVGNPGNPPDANPNPAGAVPYEYRIGKYEISEQMIDKANMLGGLGITKDTRGPDYPATSVTWFEAARFVNWLNTWAGSVLAYKFDASGNFQLWTSADAGYDANNLYRNSLAKYFLPTVDEWHKAAYYDPNAGVYYDYPTGSDNVPDGIDTPGDPLFDAVFFDGGLNPDPNGVANVGLLSKYGTAGQGGNVVEWHETAFDWQNTVPSKSRLIRGGGWGSSSSSILASNSGGGLGPGFETNSIGFRITSSVPEPNAGILIAICSITLLQRTVRSRSLRRNNDAHISKHLDLCKEKRRKRGRTISL